MNYEEKNGEIFLSILHYAHLGIEGGRVPVPLAHTPHSTYQPGGNICNEYVSNKYFCYLICVIFHFIYIIDHFIYYHITLLFILFYIYCIIVSFILFHFKFYFKFLFILFYIVVNMIYTTVHFITLSVIRRVIIIVMLMLT